jgi:hypothetical protein
MSDTAGGTFRHGEPPTTAGLVGPTGSVWTAGAGAPAFAARQPRKLLTPTLCNQLSRGGKHGPSRGRRTHDQL